MYLKKVLVENGMEYCKGMRVSFDYLGVHYIEIIEDLHDTYFETSNEKCFSYSGVENIRIGYIKGERVTVSVKALCESNVITENVFIDTEDDENGNIGYWDMYTHKDGLVCMDGETCEIITVNEDSITLKNEDGEKDVDFVLTLAEADICCFKCSE